MVRGKERADTMNVTELALLREAAEESAYAQFKLGMMYVYGDTVPEDNGKAVELLTKAADQGHVEATYNLGICYHYGHGVEADRQRALILYLFSAGKVYAKGMHLVGRFYFHGWCVKQNYAEAIRWFEESDKRNDPTTCGFNSCYLGVCYAKGYGVEANAEKARTYFKKALAEGGADAEKKIKELMK